MNSYVRNCEMSRYYQAINIPSKDGEISVYHYTSTEVLDKILDSATFWASNLYYLNDSSEFKAGILWLKDCFSVDSSKYKDVLKYLDEIENNDGMSWEGIYTISFSTEYDKLQQWITYARESGICIELSSHFNHEDEPLRSDRLVLMQIGDNDKLISASENYSGFGELDYINLNEKNERSAKRIYEQFVSAWDDINDIGQKTTELNKMQEVWEKKPIEAKRYLSLLASYYKVDGFKGEGEIRISFFPLEEDNVDSVSRTKIYYVRLSNGVLRPYIKIVFCEGDDDEHPCIPIKTICIGPSGKQQSVYESVVHRLEYGTVNVWQLSLEEKVKVLKKYIDGCLCYIADEDKNALMQNEVAFTILQEWCERTRNSNKVCCSKSSRKNKTRYGLNVFKGKLIFIPIEIPNDISEIQKERIHKLAQNYIRKYYQSEFLTRDGICVKKSKIPYIF